MRLWEFTLKELIGDLSPQGNVPPEFVEMPWEKSRVLPLVSIHSYATAPALGHNDLANQVLLKYTANNWKCVGHYVDDTIMIDRNLPREERRVASEELFIRCLEHRNRLPITSNLTEAGLSFLKRVHRREVEKAKKAGFEIPAKVLQEFPDLENDKG